MYNYEQEKIASHGLSHSLACSWKSGAAAGRTRPAQVSWLVVYASQLYSCTGINCMCSSLYGRIVVHLLYNICMLLVVREAFAPLGGAMIVECFGRGGGGGINIYTRLSPPSFCSFLARISSSTFGASHRLDFCQTFFFPLSLIFSSIHFVVVVLFCLGSKKPKSKAYSSLLRCCYLFVTDT